MTLTGTGGQVAIAVRAELEPRRDEMIEALQRLVEIESPSDDRAALDRFADALLELFADFGPISTTETPRGRHLLLSIDGAAEAQPALALCHYDTVWPLGTLGRIPFSVDAVGVARGPGCFDMKAGIVLLRFALEALRRQGTAMKRP